jgi:hypothetical protein
MATVDRFGELIEQLNIMANWQNTQRYLESRLEKIGRDLVNDLKSVYPHGQEEPSYRTSQGDTVDHGRPSLRLHDKTLADSFEETPIVGEIRGGSRMAVEVDHPTYDETKYGGTGIVEWLIHGTKTHPIPEPARILETTLSFWWGHPLRWPPKDRFSPGPRAFYGVDHPGARGQATWFEIAVTRATIELEKLQEQATDDLFFRPLDQLDFLRRSR